MKSFRLKADFVIEAENLTNAYEEISFFFAEKADGFDQDVDGCCEVEEGKMNLMGDEGDRK